MGFGVVERDVAAGYGTGGVEGMEGSSLCTVGESVGAAEVQVAVGVDHVAVVDHDRPDCCGVAEVFDAFPRNGDGYAPVDCGSSIWSEVRGVEARVISGLPKRVTPDPSIVPNEAHSSD